MAFFSALRHSVLTDEKFVKTNSITIYFPLVWLKEILNPSDATDKITSYVQDELYADIVIFPILPLGFFNGITPFAVIYVSE